MPAIWLVLMSTTVTAFIGGATNYMAIKMLFKPRRPIYIGKFRLPFTPGVIPKRHVQIARSLGEVVSSYLVTPEGLASVLRSPSLRLRLEQKMQDWLIYWGSQEDSVEQVVLRFTSEDKWQQWKSNIVAWGEEKVDQEVGRLWQSVVDKELTLGQVVPDYSPQRREQLTEQVSEYVLSALREEIMMGSLDQMLSQTIRQWTSQSGGFLGAMAGMFFDEEKMILKIKSTIISKLDTPASRLAIGGMLRTQLQNWENKTIEECLQMLSGQEPAAWLQAQGKRVIEVRAIVNRLVSLPVAALAEEYGAALQSRIPQLAEAILGWAEQHIAGMMQELKLDQLVERQVLGFPVERLETIVLGVSGKEFRAITWVGALLGGLIGLFQSLFYLWW